jgi:hypothetical protein
MPAQESQRLCQCHKCTSKNRGGILVSASTFRIHQRKRSWDQAASGDLPKVEPNPPTLTPAGPRLQDDHTPPSASTSVFPPPSLQPERLEIQDIHYQILELSYDRPVNLDFLWNDRITNEQSSNPYIYRGVFNQAPYGLVNCPANALFLKHERQLHAWAQRLQELRHVSPEPNFQLHIQSVEKDVVNRLNCMFKWKQDIYRTKYLSLAPDSDAPSIIERPLIDTSKLTHS